MFVKPKVTNQTEESTMKNFGRIAATLSVLLLAVGSLSAQDLKTDYDHSVNFSQFKTYTWLQVKTSNSLWDERLKNDVNSALIAKGLTEVPSGGDLAIVASRTSQNEQTLNTFYDGLGGGWGYRGFGGGGFGGFGESTTTTDTYVVGTVVLDIFNGNSKTLLWRGSADGTLSGNSNKNIANLDRAIEKLFAHFPPGSSKR
jgi:uncharacterized protein DUF4136